MTQDSEFEQERPAPTIRDRRRIDPETYQVREPQAERSAAPAGPGIDDPAGADSPSVPGGRSGATGASKAETSGDATDPRTDDDAEQPLDERDARIEDLTRQVAERTDDLQRLQAEYVNYKRRVDRDRETARAATIGTLLNELLPVLDNIASAREHEELTGGFKAVGEAVEKFTRNHGVESYGVAGDEFDPRIHEALMQLPDAGDGHPVCAQVFQVGYRIGERVLRPARVAVGAAPAAGSDAESADVDAVDRPVDNGADAGIE